MTLSDTYSVPCLAGKGSRPGILSVTVPGSKSITNRALLLATLAEGVSTLRGVLFSDDSRHFLNCVQELGFETTVDEKQCIVTVRGLGGTAPKSECSLYVGSAGTAARFLTAYLGVQNGNYRMTASEQMRKRPMAPLLKVLRELGCEITCEDREGYFPFLLSSHGFQRNEVTVNIDDSSQFLSALLISSCLAPGDFTVRLEGSHGMSYIDMTRKMMAQFSVTAEKVGEKAFVTKAGQHYQSRDYQIEPDVSAACYFYAMCPLLEIPVQVKGITAESMQGDMAFLSILEQMGCTRKQDPEGVILLPPQNGRISGVTVDMSACSDQAITLAAIAPFANSPTTITGIAHIRHQECDRLTAIVTELTRLGIRCDSTEDSITVYPGTPHPGRILTYEDHRMAMGFTLTGLRVPGIVIDNPACCRKTFETYYDVLEETLFNFFRK